MKNKEMLTILKTKEILSKQIRDIENRGFGYITPIIRHCLFSLISDKEYIDIIIPLLLKEQPNLSGKYV